MKINMSLADRALRLLTAVIISILYYTGVITGTWAYLLVILACLLLSTAIVGICPLYTAFRLHSNDNKDHTFHKE
jgi:TRAP-type C4-dicarboxylate transport system permease large subunit